jgi:hypothetical protein
MGELLADLPALLLAGECTNGPEALTSFLRSYCSFLIPRNPTGEA